MVQKSNAQCLHYCRSFKFKERGDKKNFKAKKHYSPAVNSNSENSGESSQALSQSYKKDFLLYKQSQRSKSCNIPATDNNITVAKNKKKTKQPGSKPGKIRCLLQKELLYQQVLQ